LILTERQNSSAAAANLEDSNIPSWSTAQPWFHRLRTPARVDNSEYHVILYAKSGPFLRDGTADELPVMSNTTKRRTTSWAIKFGVAALATGAFFFGVDVPVKADPLVGLGLSSWIILWLDGWFRLDLTRTTKTRNELPLRNIFGMT
jgi:hypothetical protein